MLTCVKPAVGLGTLVKNSRSCLDATVVDAEEWIIAMAPALLRGVEVVQEEPHIVASSFLFLGGGL